MLRYSYTLMAPFYDALVMRATLNARRASLARLRPQRESPVVLVGVGSGLDIPLLPPGPDYLGVDLTPAMLRRAQQRQHITAATVHLVQGDAHHLPCADARYAAVILHLILAVAPQPQRTLAEAVRVLRPGGQLLILDKFLRNGQRAPLRRFIGPLIGRLATRTDVELEPLLAAQPELRVIDDQPALVGGWFRQLTLEKL